jgi:nucleoside-diphosphate-sugar epimerase
MPSVAPGSKILVTGANGYIALWVLRKLLEQGYSVRAQVRSEAKGKHLKEYFKSYADKIELVVVEDITKDGAFDEAVKGVAGIEHMASPLNLSTDDPDDYIIPAVQGTLSVLKSALKEGGNVKRIVITSSLAAIFSTVTNPPRTFTESDWADEFVEAVQRKGKQSTGNEKYKASKTLAEKNAWDFYTKHKSEVTWDLVVLNPPLVIGPPLQEVPTPARLNASLEGWFNMVFKEQPEGALKGTYGYVHVEDISQAHILVLQKEEAGGERIIVSAGNDTWQSTRNLLRKLYPEYYSSGILPAGNSNDPGDITAIYDNKKGKKILGLEYKSPEVIAKDTIADFKARGWLEKKYDT